MRVGIGKKNGFGHT